MGAFPGVWTEQRLVEAFDVDVRGRLRPQTLFAYLVNAAWNHARGSVYGYEHLAAENMAWLLIKMQILIRRTPRWGDALTLETWARWAERLYATRDFAVTSASGEKLVSATSVWIILNRATGRPHRFDPERDGLPWQPGRRELETDTQKVPELHDAQRLARYRVLFSDIDVNRHVGSSRYLQWMMDSHATALLEACELAAIELSFLAEALPDDEVAVFSEPAATGEQAVAAELCDVSKPCDVSKLWAVRRASDDRELCRARLVWRSPA